MSKMSNFLSIIKTGIILFLITGIAACILAAINNVTEPIIEKNDAVKQELAMKNVMPDAEEFVAEEFNETDVVKALYVGKKDDEKKGYVVVTEPMGYGGAISMVVGVDCSGVVTGVDITGQSETAGLGANCTKDEFKDQFKGKTAGISVVKSNASENQIDAMTSATVTSNAVTKGVNAAIDVVKAKEGGNKK